MTSSSLIVWKQFFTSLSHFSHSHEFCIFNHEIFSRFSFPSLLRSPHNWSSFSIFQRNFKILYSPRTPSWMWTEHIWSDLHRNLIPFWMFWMTTKLYSLQQTMKMQTKLFFTNQLASFQWARCYLSTFTLWLKMNWEKNVDVRKKNVSSLSLEK